MRGDAVESPGAACKFFRIPKISIFDSVTALGHNIASNNPDSRAGCPWNFKRVYTRVHQRKGGQSYHRPPVNSSEFPASYNKESKQT